MVAGLCPSLSPPPSHSHYIFPNGCLRRSKFPLSPVVVLFYASFVHSARTGHLCSLSSSQHTLNCSLAELPSQVVMSAPNLRKGTSICLCSCGCNHRVSRQTAWHHSKRVQPESSRPLKRRRIAHFQTKSPIITPDKQRRSCTDNISSSSHSHVDASDHPQLHAPSLDEFNPSLPLLNPPASNLFQPQGDALTEASSVFIDNFLRNLLTQTHQSDDEGSEGAFKGDAAEAADIDHDTGNSKNGEGVTVEGDADPCEGMVSDWDLLAEEFIVEAKELGNFRHYLLHTL